MSHPEDGAGDGYLFHDTMSDDAVADVWDPGSGTLLCIGSRTPVYWLLHECNSSRY